MIVLAGLVLLLLGLASGLVLALAPLGVLSPLPGPTPWLLFPVLTLVGTLLLALRSRTSALPVLTRVAGSLILALAVVAAVALFLVSSSLVPRPVGTLSLWYVLVMGLVLGGASLSAHTAVGPRT